MQLNSGKTGSHARQGGLEDTMTGSGNGHCSFFPIRTRARTGTCQECAAWVKIPPPLTEVSSATNPALIFQHCFWMSDVAAGSQRGLTSVLYNCCLHVCTHVHSPAHIQQSSPPCMGEAGACQRLGPSSHGHDRDQHEAGRPHMPPCPDTPALTTQYNAPWEQQATFSHF